MKNFVLISVIGGLGLFVVLAVGLSVYCGSSGAALAWLNDRPFYLSPRIVRLENRDPGAEEIVSLRLRNLTSEEISVVGENTSCSCLVSEELPIKVAARETGEVKLRVSLPKYKSDYEQQILLMISARGKLKLADVRVLATISNPLPEPTDEPKAKTKEEVEPPTETEIPNESESDASEPASEEHELAE